MSCPSLFAFFAHPDDEAFSCGGTLAAAASRGIDVTVVCATRGERGPDQGGPSPEDLATRRSRELESSCRALGARPPVLLDLPDGELAEQRETLAVFLKRQLDDAQPDVAITMGPDGAYGHLDHVVCSEVLTEQAALVAERPTVLHVVFPAGLFETLQRRLGRAGVPLVHDQSSRPDVDYVVDIRAFERAKLASIAAHRSQLTSGDPRSFLLTGIVDQLLGEERFRHAGGPVPSDEFASLFVST